MAIRLIVGLGNPGTEFAGTRHNIGADWVEDLAYRHSIPMKVETKFHGLTGRGTVAGRDVRLLIPTTYMNNSGQAVSALASFFKLSVDEQLIVHDEMAFEPGTLRLKTGGGAGGHNGLRDLIASGGKKDGFHRLRIGVGHPGSASRVNRYLTVNKMPEPERAAIEANWRLDPLLPDLLAGNLELVMNELHTAT